MTGEQQNPKAETPPAFGDIPINPQAGTTENEKKEPVSPPESKRPRPEKPRRQRAKSKDLPGKTKKRFLLCSLMLILLPTALFLSYLAAARYLLPYYIQEQLTKQYSRQLNRPVTVTRVEFAPFTFDLHLAGIHIGPKFDRQDGEEPALCRIAALDTRLRPQELLQRRVVLENMRIKGMQVEAVRRADGSFTDPGLSQLSQNGRAGLVNQTLLPNWLRIDGFSLTDSMLVIRDATNGNEYHLDEITFSLPSAATQQKSTQQGSTEQGAAEPALYALVNGSPVQIQGQRQLNPDGSSATRLVLRLDDVDPQQLLAWLPGTGDSLRINTDRTEAVLELILPDKKPDDTGGPSLSGTINFTGLQLDALSTGDGAARSDKLGCTVPNAQLIIRANPFRQQYTVEELILDQPRLIFTDSADKTPRDQVSSEKLSSEILPVFAKLQDFFDPSSFSSGLIIKRLTINQGTVKDSRGSTWKELQLELTAYRNKAAAPVKEEAQESTALIFSARQGDTTVQFQGTAAPDLSLIGKISLDNLDSSALQPYLDANLKANKANKTVQVSGGKTRLVMQINPLLKQYKVDELTLDQPRFVLAAGKAGSGPNLLPLSVRPGQLLDPASLPFDLMIRHLTINKGTIQKKQGPPWKELQLELTAYRNRGNEQAEKAAALSFSAQQGETTLRFEGTTAPDLSLTGKISLNNLDPNLLQPYLNAREDVLLTGGQTELSGLLRTVQAEKGGKKKILIDKGTITLRDIRLKQKEQGKDKVLLLLTAQMAESKGCSIDLDPASPSLSCADLLLSKAEFSPDAPSVFLFPEKAESLLGLSVNTVRITDSTASLRPGSSQNGQSGLNGQNGLTIPLTALHLDISDLQGAASEKDNLHVQADVGPDGKLTADGYFRQGKGKLKLAVNDFDITLLNPAFVQLFQKEFALSLQHGRLSVQGLFRVPELDFQGDVQLKDLLAENHQGTVLGWKNGQGEQTLVGMKPFFVHIDEFIVQEPELKLNSPESGLPGSLISLLRRQDNKPVLPPFTIKQCRIQEGSMPGSGSHPGFAAVNGTLADLAAGTPSTFTFSGKVNERKFTAQGRLDQNRAELDNFTVAELPMESAAKQFAAQLGLEEKGEIRWVPSPEQNSPEQKDEGSLHFSGFLPQPNSKFSLLLALLTDSHGKFSLSLSLPATASPAEISQAALKKLQRLHLQAVVSPQAILEKSLPDLTLPRRVDFIVGDRLPDFMDNLDNFVPLFSRRPYLRLHVRGCYDNTTDREYLLRLLQEEEDYRIDLENVRRHEEMARLIAEEELRQVELINTDMPIGEDLVPAIEAREDLQPMPRQQVEIPKKILPELARQRALVVQKYLVDTLNLPAEKITLAEPTPGGPWVDLLIEPQWQQAPETTRASPDGGGE